MLVMHFFVIDSRATVDRRADSSMWSAAPTSVAAVFAATSKQSGWCCVWCNRCLHSFLQFFLSVTRSSFNPQVCGASVRDVPLWSNRNVNHLFASGAAVASVCASTLNACSTTSSSASDSSFIPRASSTSKNILLREQRTTVNGGPQVFLP